MSQIRSAVWIAVFALTPMVSFAAIVETAHLVVTGGPNAGTYDSSSEKGGCTYGFAGAGSWGNQLSSPKDPDQRHFNSLQLIVPDAKKAAGGSKEFFLLVGFGPLLHRGAEYRVETRANEAKSGSGTVTVIDRGTTGMVKFDAITGAGVKLAGTIDCKAVLRSGK